MLNVLNKLQRTKSIRKHVICINKKKYICNNNFAEGVVDLDAAAVTDNAPNAVPKRSSACKGFTAVAVDFADVGDDAVVRLLWVLLVWMILLWVRLH